MRQRIDPRIRARRIAVAREQGRRRLRVVLVVLTRLRGASGRAWLVVQSPMLDVDHIVVTGIPPERVAAVIAASGVHRRDPLLLVSTGAVARRVEQVPGIGSVHVSRELPGNAAHQRAASRASRSGRACPGRCRAHRLRRSRRSASRRRRRRTSSSCAASRTFPTPGEQHRRSPRSST